MMGDMFVEAGDISLDYDGVFSSMLCMGYGDFLKGPPRPGVVEELDAAVWKIAVRMSIF